MMRGIHGDEYIVQLSFDCFAEGPVYRNGRYGALDSLASVCFNVQHLLLPCLDLFVGRVK